MQQRPYCTSKFTRLLFSRLSQMVLTRVPLEYTFGQHSLVAEGFSYDAVQVCRGHHSMSCADPGLVNMHIKCVTSRGWGDNMRGSFRTQFMHGSEDMNDYILRRCLSGLLASRRRQRQRRGEFVSAVAGGRVMGAVGRRNCGVLNFCPTFR